MKKIIFLLFLLAFTACNNPFKKYEDSFDLLQANLDAAKRVDAAISTITELTSGIDDYENLTISQMQSLNVQLDSIKNEVTSGKLDLLLANYTTYPEETKDVLDKIDGYMVEVNDAIEALELVAGNEEKIEELKKAQASAKEIAAYLKNKMNIT